MKSVSVGICVLVIGALTGCVLKTNSPVTPSPIPSPTAQTSLLLKTSSPSASATIKVTSKASSTAFPTKTAAATAKPSSTQSSATSSPSSSSTTVAATSTPTRSPTPVPTATPSNNSGTITVSPTSITQTVDRSQSSGGVIALNSYTITSQGADYYNIVRVGTGSAFSSTGGSGGMTTGLSRTIPVNLNESGIANGTYTQSFIVQYGKNGTTFSGPTVTYTVTLTGSSPSQLLTTNTTSINETLSKSSPGASTVVQGNGFTLTSAGADSYSIDTHYADNDTFHNIAFDPLGGNLTSGQSVTIHPRASVGMTNGTYSSYVLVRYFKNSLTVENPITVNYTITVTD